MRETYTSSVDGSLCDLKTGAVIRKDYARHYQNIETVAQLKATLRAGAYAWPGGYPLYFITSDGGALAFDTVRAEFRSVVWSIANKVSDGWRVNACTINYEDGDLVDDHTGKRIESAYAEDSEEKAESAID